MERQWSERHWRTTMFTTCCGSVNWN
jgi:hypothetical protein